jgi:transposase InsO family protein
MAMGALHRRPEDQLPSATHDHLRPARVSWRGSTSGWAAPLDWATRYNTRRRHSYLGHQAPNTYETSLMATLQQPPNHTNPVSKVRG